MGVLSIIIFVILIISIPTLVLGTIYACLLNNALIFVLPFFVFIISNLLFMFTFAKFITSTKINLSNYDFFNFHNKNMFRKLLILHQY